MQINHSIAFSPQDIESARALKCELNYLIPYVNDTKTLIINGRTYNLQALIQIQDFLNDIVVSQNQICHIKHYNDESAK